MTLMMGSLFLESGIYLIYLNYHLAFRESEKHKSHKRLSLNHPEPLVLAVRSRLAGSKSPEPQAKSVPRLHKRFQNALKRDLPRKSKKHEKTNQTCLDSLRSNLTKDESGISNLGISDQVWSFDDNSYHHR